MNAHMIVNGKKVSSVTGKTINTVSPFNGEVVAKVPFCNNEDVRLAIEAANNAQSELKDMTVFQRSDMLFEIASQIEKNKEKLAKTISLETGKVYETEAIGEVTVAIQGFRNVAEQIKWIYGSTVNMEDSNKKTFSFYEPKGTYAVIGPYNFPVNIPTEYIAPGLAAGNSIVFLPTLTTSYTAIHYVEILHEAGVPKGAVNVITGDGGVVGEELVSNSGIDGVGFTGSTPTGEIIARNASTKSTILELGGNGPAIILEDAEIDKAAKAIAEGCFICTGQTCASAERILVHESLQDELASKVSEKAQNIKLGDPMDKNTEMGPLHDENVAHKMDKHVKDAVKKGANILTGGKRAEGYNTNLMYEPTVLTNITENSLINAEETFGPIAPMIPFKNKEEALKIAKQGNFGLLTSVHTANPKNVFFFAKHLNSGIININENTNFWEVHVPFGGGAGTKSGNSRIGGFQMIKQMSDLKTIVWDIS